jgi:hypothetical protein
VVLFVLLVKKRFQKENLFVVLIGKSELITKKSCVCL